MGNPIRVSPEIKSELREMAETILQRGRIPEGDERSAVGSAIRGLGEGFDVNVRILLDAVSEYGSAPQRRRADELGTSIDVLKRTSTMFAGSYKVVWHYDPAKFDESSLEVGNFPSSGVVSKHSAVNRAESVRDPLKRDPSEAITYIFEPIGSIAAAKGTFSNGSDETAFDLLEAVIGGNIANQFRSVVRSESGDLVIPPAPTVARFHDLMRERLGQEGIRYDAWKGLDYWKLGVAFLFADLLTKGVVEGDMSDVTPSQRPEVLLASRREAYGQLGVWFKGLINLFDMPYLEAAVMRWYKGRDDDRVLALAELSRFGQLTKNRPWKEENAPDVLFKNMVAVHRTFPHVDGEEFKKLLAPLLRPFDFEGVKGFFKKLTNDPKGFNRFKARLIFLWHAGDPEKYLGEVAKVIKHNKHYTTIEEFLSARLECTVKDFTVKLKGLKGKGADISPVLEAVEGKFPGAISGRKYAAHLLDRDFAEGSEAKSHKTGSVWDEVANSHSKRRLARDGQLALRPVGPTAEMTVEGPSEFSGIARDKRPHQHEADAEIPDGASSPAVDASVSGAVQMVLPFLAVFKPVS
jgi:hypothetical protein